MAVNTDNLWRVSYNVQNDSPKQGESCVFGAGPSIEYKNDKITYGGFGPNILNSKINKATAHGGWTRMDYVLDILTEEQKLLNDCAQILDEIERQGDEIEKLKKRVRDFKDWLASVIESSKTEKPQLDKDGCLYWDYVIKKEE